MTAPPPTTRSVIATIAAITLRRLWRGRLVWVSVALALLPVAFAALVHRAHKPGHLLIELFLIEELALAVLPPLLVASSIGEDIEDRTTTYLWSRPIRRWAIVAGKLIALVPITMGLLAAGWAIAVPIALGHLPGLTWMISAVAAIAIGAVALSVIAAGITALVPNHAMALTLAYVLFFDAPVGALPASIRQLSVTHQLRVIAAIDPTIDESRTLALVSIAAIAGVWGAIALWRIRRREA